MASLRLGSLLLLFLSAGSAKEGVSPCPPASNTTRNFFRCLTWKEEHGLESMWDESFAPSEEAESEAMSYLNTLRESKDKLGHYGFTVTKPEFEEISHRWLAGQTSPPYIYKIEEAWAKTCDYTEESVGYRYSLEHYLNNIWKRGVVHVVQDMQFADYVLIPHCATGMFMHFVAKYSLELEARNKEDLSTKKRKGRKRMNATEHFLLYEGSLPERAVRTTDDRYLMKLLTDVVIPHPAFEMCVLRENCRFLIPSIYGRHVFRRFSQFFEGKAIFVTHAGLSPWITQQANSFFVPPLLKMSKTPIDADNDCQAACDLHCVFDPPATLENDIVMPWTVAYSWTQRSAWFLDRDILAFYSGTDNSCSREQIRELFGADFNKEIEHLTVVDTPPRESSSPIDPFISKSVLMFPASLRLSQREWSEVAYRSRICICPDGDSPNTGRIIEVILHGCVPLIISDRLQPPFHELVDWSNFAFFMREADIPRLPEILARFATPKGMMEVKARQRKLGQAAMLFNYDHSLVGMLLMFSLIQKRDKFAPPPNG